MPVLVDGNNLLHSLPVGDRTRDAVRRLMLELSRQQRMRATVVFDGPPPTGAPRRESLGALTVLYAGPRSADDVILSCLPAGRAARNWSVVTDDRELARRVRDIGSDVRSLREWRNRLGTADRQSRGAEKPNEPASPDELAAWEEYFASGRQADED